MPRLTLNRVFALSLVGFLIGLGLLFWLVFHGLQVALLESAQHTRERNSAVIGQSVTDYLGQAPEAAGNFDRLVAAGLINPADPNSLRNGLLSVLLSNEDISEATFTSATSTGTDAQGTLVVDPASVSQVSLFRGQFVDGFVHRVTSFQHGSFLTRRAQLFFDGHESPMADSVLATNPASHLTFSTPTRRDFYGQLLWTDIHWSELSGTLPRDRRRVEMSVQKTVDSSPGHFAGVLRIGLFKDAIDHSIEMPAAVDTPGQAIFICDGDGRLIALSGSDQYVESGDDLRLSTAGAPAEVMDALKQPALHTADESGQPVAGHYITSGTAFLFTFRLLPKTQDWIVGMTVPASSYLGDLLAIRRNVEIDSLLLVVIIACFGFVILHGVSRAHAIIVREAARMNDFILDPSQNTSHLYDINRVLASLERAKTAMRSMGKYVPLELVRRLYHRGEEPRLGGEDIELSVLFTDIQGFTAFAERVDPGVVAERLGAYLHVMVSVIQRERGTIDKFIGDSVMAFWNAPEAVPSHAVLACRTALACREALNALYQSPEWGGEQSFATRFGLHHCVATVGHFGSPERFNYTAIGDGINLASRLEGLNKRYGTAIIASAGLRAAAGDGFIFRHLDRVSVQGKTQSLDIYELIGEVGRYVPAYVAIYEEALEAYFKGDFTRALGLVEGCPDDPPSLFLACRCREFLDSPPAVGWTGVYIFETK